MSREKHTFTSAELPHIWANQKATWGKSPGNMSFEGKAIKSYGTEIARLIEFKGKQAVIFNETTYSVTTSSVQGCILRAIPGHLPVFKIGSISMGCSLDFYGEEGLMLFRYAINQAEYAKEQASTARSRKAYYLERQSFWLTEAGRVNEFFGLKHQVDENTINRLVAIAEKEKKRQAKALAEAAKKRRKECQELYDLWKAGDETVYPGSWVELFPIAFRIEEGDKKELVSTYGARVSLKAAGIAVRFVNKHRASGWKTNGETMVVDGYRFVQVSKDEIHIGCHHVTWEEFDRIAPLIEAALSTRRCRIHGLIGSMTSCPECGNALCVVAE